MEWHISPIARASNHSEANFEKGDRVASFLVRGEEEIHRIDVLESEEVDYQFPGDVICRWTQIFKPRSTTDKEAKEAMKLTADNLFIALFDGEEEPTMENAELKHFLALMLERRRVLRPMEQVEEYYRFIHRPTKQEFFVPRVDLDPEFFIENQEKLSFLLTGTGEDSSPSDAEAESKPES